MKPLVFFYRSVYDMASEKTKALVDSILKRIEERLKVIINTANNKITVSRFSDLNVFFAL